MLNASISFNLLLITTIICIIVLTVFIAKLIISITKLSDSANVIAKDLAQELEPTLKELKGAAKSINSIANIADEKFQSAKTAVASANITSKLKSFSKGILKGIAFGLGFFRK